MQQLEWEYSLTLAVDAKNIALEKLKAHKKGTTLQGEATEIAEPPAAETTESALIFLLSLARRPALVPRCGVWSPVRHTALCRAEIK